MATANQSVGHAGVAERPWSGRTRGGVIGNWILLVVAGRLGLRAASLLLIPVAFYFLLFAPSARKAAHAYRRRLGCRGEEHWWSRAWTGYRHFYSFGQILLDRAAIFGAGADRFTVNVENPSCVESALAQGRGLIMLSAHCGNWEAAAHFLPRHVDATVNVVVFEGELPRVRRLLEKSRRSRSFNIIGTDGSAESSFAIVAALHRGEVVAMLADRSLTSEGEIVSFLGSPARFPTGPHAAAATCGAPVIDVFSMRESFYRYRIHLYPAAASEAARCREPRAELRPAIERFAARLEAVLKKWPLQWHNFFDFWETASSPKASES